MPRSAILVLSFLVVLAIPAWAQERAETILSVELDGHVLNDGMLAFQENGELLLPLAELARSLDFFVEADSNAATISGWVLREDRTFVLDGPAGVITTATTSIPIPATADLADLAVAGEAYIPSETFSEIWPVEFIFQPRRLRLIVRALEPLPLQWRLEREYARNVTFGIAAARTRPNLPDATVPYGALSGGIAHVEADLAIEEGAVGRITVNAQHDLLWTAANWSYANRIEDNGQETQGFFHAAFERRAEVRPMPLGIARIRAGDISTPANSEMVGAKYGRGIEVVSQGETNDVFDEIDVQGSAPPNWEAELYINQALIDFQHVSIDGRYRFGDVPLQYGTNFVEVHLFGPHGEEQFDRRVIEVPPQSARPGEFAWTLRGGETVPLISFSDDEGDEEATQWFQAQAAYGMDELLTLQSGIEAARHDDETYFLGSIGAGFTALNTFFRPRMLASHEGTLGAGISLARNFEHGQFLAEATYFNGIESPELSFGEKALRYRVNADLTVTPAPSQFRTVLTANISFEEEMDGGQRSEVLARQITIFRATNISNQIRWTEANDESTVTGHTIISRRRQNFDGRLALDYTIDDDPLLRAAGTLSLQSTDRDWRWSASAAHDFRAAQSTLSGTVARHFERFELGLTAEVASDGEARAGLHFSSTFGLTDRDGFTMSAGDATGAGVAQVTVFLDTNGDGIRNVGEATLPGVGVRVNGGIIRERTNANGRVILHDLVTRGRSAITIDLRTVEDPMLLPGNEGVSLIARPGTLARLELPVVETGLIDGTLVGESGGPSAAATVLLLGSDGEELDRTETAYDGYFAFEPLRLGRYRLQAIGASAAPEITLTSEEPFVFGIVIRN